MSKIAEQKIKELGHSKDPLNRAEYTANDIFDCGVECYDQAMQDFLEKACGWLLHNTMRELLMNSESTELVEDFIEDFKNYIENES